MKINRKKSSIISKLQFLSVFLIREFFAVYTGTFKKRSIYFSIRGKIKE